MFDIRSAELFEVFLAARMAEIVEADCVIIAKLVNYEGWDWCKANKSLFCVVFPKRPVPFPQRAVAPPARSLVITTMQCLCEIKEQAGSPKPAASVT